MKFQKTLLATMVLAASTTALAQAPVDQISDDQQITWGDLKKIINGDPTAPENSQERNGVVGTINHLHDHFRDILFGTDDSQTQDSAQEQTPPADPTPEQQEAIKKGVIGLLNEKATQAELEALKASTLEAFKELATAANEDNATQNEKFEQFVAYVDENFKVLNQGLNGDETLADDEEDPKKVGLVRVVDRHTEAIKDLAQDLEQKASHTDLDSKADKSALDKKADKTEVEDVKAAVKYIADGLAEHLPTFATKEELEAKADKSDLDAKADKTEVAELDTKWTNVVGGLTEEIGNRLDAKADKTQVDEIAGKVGDLETHATNVSNTLIDLIEHMNNNDEALEEHIKLTNNNLTQAIGTRVSKAKYDADQTKVNEELAKKADKDYVDGIAETAQNALQGLADNITGLAESTNRDLNGLKDKTTAMSEKLDTTEVRVTNVEAAVKTKADKDYVDAQLETKADKTALETKADKAVVEAELEKKADKAAFDAAKTTLDATVVRVDALEQSMNNSNNAVVGRVAKLETRVDNLDARVNEVQTDLRRGMASQAALAGLFQPYNVGKVNVTAALGGYKSESAVALGAGYRVTDKFAAKAGFTLGSGSSAYNISVNYEF